MLAPIFLFVTVSSNDFARSRILSNVQGTSHGGWVFVLTLGRRITGALLASLFQLSQPAGESTTLCFFPDSKGSQCLDPVQTWHCSH